MSQAVVSALGVARGYREFAKLSRVPSSLSQPVRLHTSYQSCAPHHLSPGPSCTSPCDTAVPRDASSVRQFTLNSPISWRSASGLSRFVSAAAEPGQPVRRCGRCQVGGGRSHDRRRRRSLAHAPPAAAAVPAAAAAVGAPGAAPAAGSGGRGAARRVFTATAAPGHPGGRGQLPSPSAEPATEEVRAVGSFWGGRCQGRRSRRRGPSRAVTRRALREPWRPGATPPPAAAAAT